MFAGDQEESSQKEKYGALNLPRDLAPIALPAIKLATQFKPGNGFWEPLMFGGAPNLPDGLDWPRMADGRPLHFFAQIDLGTLPRGMTLADKDLGLPEFPKTGTLFYFLPLAGTDMYDGGAVVLYSAQDVRQLPERAPPADTPALDAGSHVAVLSAVSACGTMLKRQYGTYAIALSSRDDKPDWQEGDAGLPQPQRPKRDLAYQKQLHKRGLPYHHSAPLPMAEIDPLFADIPASFQDYFERGRFQWTWDYIFEFGKQAYRECCELPVRELMFMCDDGADAKNARHLRERMLDKLDDLDAEVIEGPSKGWEKFKANRAPGLQMRDDVRFARWMSYARHQARTGAVVNEGDKRKFIDMLAHVGQEATANEKAHLRILARVAHHDFRKRDVHRACINAFQTIAVNRTDLHPTAGQRPKSPVEQNDALPTQIFGAGALMQRAALDHEDKVLLMQVSQAAGADYARYDMLMQIWITPEDLAMGTFDKITTTLELG